MSEKAQFPNWKIGIFVILISLSALVSKAGKSEVTKESMIPHVSTEFAEPKIVGPDALCVVFGQVVGTYSAGGDVGDVYDWTVTNPAGEVILTRSGGEQLETIQVVFSEIGTYTIALQVRRGTNFNYYQESKSVEVQKGPQLALLPDYLLCAGSATVLTALDPSSSDISEFTIEWKDIDGNLLGTGNEYLTYSAGYHLVELYRTGANGAQSCLITGSTFVGPPIDFEIELSSTTFCEGGTIEVGLDTPLTGDWFIQKGFTGARELAGQGFEIEFESEDLSGPGLYIVTFQTTSEEYPDCISERFVGFELLESPQATISITEQPDDCVLTNGAFDITLSTDVDALYIPELNYTQGSLSSGQSISFPDLEPKVYSVVIEKAGCQTTTLVQLDSKNPPTSSNPPSQTPPTITTTDETCSPNGVVSGNVNVQFGIPISNGTYRILEKGRGLTDSGEIPANGEFQVELKDGSYLLEINIDGCTYPIEEIEIGDAPQVNFTVPAELNICETFVLEPDTDQDISFTLTYPDGTEESLNSGQAFTLTEEGEYTIFGEGNGNNANLCPKIIEFSATFSKSISFSPYLAIDKCFDPIRFKIELQGISIEEASIRWFNDQGDIVGRAPEFYPAGVGLYSLLVQPLASGYCPVDPVEFEVVAPITSVPMNMAATKICPLPSFGVVTLTTDEEEVANTEWIYYDSLNNRQELPEFLGQFEIEVTNPGTYEAVAYNQMGCEIGRNLIAVEASTLLTPPQLDDTYAICSKKNTMEGINPGDYESYEWYFENELVSTSSTYKPTLVGEYSLTVTTIDGCVFTDSFTTYDACDFQVVYPNAMVIGDSNRNFGVIVSEGVTEASLYILNRQGALIYQEDTQEIAYETPILQWDGMMLNGKKVPLGTYVVVLLLRNPTYGFEEKLTGSLLVIE
ncbi:hypothetical protein [Algoriphagus zhangzhouensis]|uniref:C-terminal domain of CHU protein family protein n=1 Tax=Algoriphagus zhangzhouensis TaxID=1073327 RepID=A0A1M7ZEP8_9BACT|nr:hypothetical protein [Algoriphagus zhangzhouensis]TDY46094.1 hypothetical protein A8938_2701 [Algoriphagus zhangzhouensis]SHO63357.1 hypothetical protein SAMN04488108_2698 [Algoriphagus zhangzhouensis]